MIRYIIISSFILVLCSCGSSTEMEDHIVEPPIVENPLPSIYRQLTTQNRVGRHGYYYLPTGYNQSPKPLMILFHGTNYDGKYMVDLFKELAELYKFILIAPDSNHSDPEWLVPDYPGIFTEDFTHTEQSINEILSLQSVKVDYTRILAGGWSGGGWFAAYFSTNNFMITKFAVLHGGVTLESLGNNKVYGYFTSGDTDNICSPSFVNYYAQETSNSGYFSIYTPFLGDHFIHSIERQSLIDWWLQ